MHAYIEFTYLQLTKLSQHHWGSSMFCLKAWQTLRRVRWSPSMWANLSLLSSDAFFAYLVGQQQISSAHLSGKRKKSLCCVNKNLSSKSKLLTLHKRKQALQYNCNYHKDGNKRYSISEHFVSTSVLANSIQMVSVLQIHLNKCRKKTEVISKYLHRQPDFRRNRNLLVQCKSVKFSLYYI